MICCPLSEQCGLLSGAVGIVPPKSLAVLECRVRNFILRSCHRHILKVCFMGTVHHHQAAMMERGRQASCYGHSKLRGLSEAVDAAHQQTPCRARGARGCRAFWSALALAVSSGSILQLGLQAVSYQLLPGVVITMHSRSSTLQCLCPQYQKSVKPFQRLLASGPQETAHGPNAPAQMSADRHGPRMR